MPLNPPQDYRKTAWTHRRGLRADQPLASDVLEGTLYYVTDEQKTERSNGVTWDDYTDGGGGPVTRITNNYILGLDGIDGESGEDSYIPGPIGPAGISGATGPAGSTGIPGPPGFDGQDGLDGLDGFSIVGPQGATGSQGIQGFQGLPGQPGLDGLDGIDGIDGIGIPGVAGAAGAQGAQGIQGPQGPQGPPGLDAEEAELPYIVPGPVGNTGATGSTGPSAITRISGSSGAAGSDITFQILTSNSSDVSTVALSSSLMTTTGVGAGTWKIKYSLLCQCGTAAQGIGFGINHTGASSAILQAIAFSISTGGTAATGVIDEDTATVGGQMAEGKQKATINAVIGSTFAGAATNNATFMVILEAILSVTNSGSLELKISVETGGNNVRLMAGTILELSKIS